MRWSTPRKGRRPPRPGRQDPEEPGAMRPRAPSASGPGNRQLRDRLSRSGNAITGSGRPRRTWGIAAAGTRAPVHRHSSLSRPTPGCGQAAHPHPGVHSGDFERNHGVTFPCRSLALATWPSLRSSPVPGAGSPHGANRCSRIRPWPSARPADLPARGRGSVPAAHAGAPPGVHGAAPGGQPTSAAGAVEWPSVWYHGGRDSMTAGGHHGRVPVPPG